MVPRHLHFDPLIFASEMSYVLVMELDQAYLESTTQLFLEQGFDVKQAMDGGEGLSMVMEREPRVILLAEEMPSLEGVELLPLLRRVTRAPIIVLGSGGEASVVRALLQGADMYLTRPVNHPELISRVRVLFRRSEAEPGDNLPATSHMAYGERAEVPPISLTSTESRLMRCLLKDPDRVISHRALMFGVWGSPVDGRRLRFYISRLRRKLDNTLPFRLLSQRGVGYRLVIST